MAGSPREAFQEPSSPPLTSFHSLAARPNLVAPSAASRRRTRRIGAATCSAAQPSTLPAKHSSQHSLASFSRHLSETETVVNKTCPRRLHLSATTALQGTSQATTRREVHLQRHAPTVSAIEGLPYVKPPTAGKCSLNLDIISSQQQSNASKDGVSPFAADELQLSVAASKKATIERPEVVRRPSTVTSSRSLPARPAKLEPTGRVASAIPGTSTISARACSSNLISSGTNGGDIIQSPFQITSLASARSPQLQGDDIPLLRDTEIMQRPGTSVKNGMLLRAASSLRLQSSGSADSQSSSASDNTWYGGAVSRSGLDLMPTPHGGRFRPANRPSQWLRDASSKVGIGIETEFLLKARRPAYKATGMKAFADIVADTHNANVVPQDIWMYNDIGWNGTRSEFDEWVLSKEETVSRNQEPWGVEMSSPLLVAFPNSHWRSYVEATWKVLEECYEITGDRYCATHIHISVEGGYSLQELKRVAQSVIHFEPALDALVPTHRRAPHNEFAMSNWLDSKSFAYQNRTRAESIRFIESLTDFYSFLQAMNPEGDRRYGFNFRSVEKYHTVEFRKAPTSRTASDCLRWAELALSFVQSATRFASADKLAHVPQTVGGLRWFLQQSHVPGLNEPHHLDWFWAHTHPDDFVEAAPMAFCLSPTRAGKMEGLRERDRREIAAFAKTAKKPYWKKGLRGTPTVAERRVREKTGEKKNR